jgi:orotate phosphoribosyltransferase
MQTNLSTLTESQLISKLLEIKAIQIQPSNPFTFASGIKSPVYSDGRLVISEPILRKQIAATFAQQIKEKYPETEIISGVATGSIAMSAWVADEMSLPMIYWRKPKGYGHNKTFEGKLEAGQKVIIIEDAVSTGTSSLSAVKDLRAKGADVLAVFVMYSHDLQEGIKNYADNQIACFPLCTFNDLVEYAQESEMLDQKELETLKLWHKDPQNWIGKM